jgi:arsenate reductase
VTREHPEILFVCVQNAGRSQMAAALIRALSAGRVRAAGCDPADRINPATVAAMGEIGLELSREFPKPLTDEAIEGADMVVTVDCGDACRLRVLRRTLIVVAKCSCSYSSTGGTSTS